MGAPRPCWAIVSDVHALHRPVGCQAAPELRLGADRVPGLAPFHLAQQIVLPGPFPRLAKG
eukprot:8243009-Lingulodinium_polyedra.AAC.1